ncbi:hypothetical protein [Nonomuraea lactucae]|uniref:hypothetical protein n=1 Tax=Nonomuraea lactucae TaxID=2249762 RepID=UPI001F051E9D|nr:hypothetical protein [Nonomuraea lactucae]
MFKSRFGALESGVAFAMTTTAAAVLATSALPALAGTCAPSTTCETTVTFAVTSGDGLQVTVPDGPVSLGSAEPGDQISGPLGGITVSDERAALGATWTATVSGTDFTTGGGTPAETVPDGDIGYWSGPATATTGTGTFVPGQPNASDAEWLNHPYTAFRKTSGSGYNSATWNPTIVVDVPAEAVEGTYTGTISHSVA